MATLAPKAPPTKTQAAGAGALIAIAGAAMAAILSPMVARFEDGPRGPALVPYRDIVGIWTQCSGETLGVTATSAKETLQGCAIKLDRRLAGFATGVATRNPALRGHDNQWAAATSLAYNIGLDAYGRSTVARRFSAGQWRAACDAMLMWNRAGGRVVQGLINRRAAERALCLKELPHD